MDDHLGERDLGRPDRPLRGPLEVHDAEQLVAVDDRRGDLARDIVACREVVGVGEDVRHELGLPRGCRAADDPATDLELVERGGVAGDADHREPVPPDRQVERHQRDLELARDVVDDVADDRLDWLRAVEPGDDPVERLERVESFTTLRRERRGASLRVRRDTQDGGHAARRDERHDGRDHELVAQVALEHRPLA